MNTNYLQTEERYIRRNLVEQCRNRIIHATSSTLDMTENLLGLGWKLQRLRWLYEHLLISASSALLTSSPSRRLILTSEFAIADLRTLCRFDVDVFAEVGFLWSLHRNEPGCVDGEHIHVRFFRWLCRLTASPATDEEEVDRWKEVVAKPEDE